MTKLAGKGVGPRRTYRIALARGQASEASTKKGRVRQHGGREVIKVQPGPPEKAACPPAWSTIPAQGGRLWAHRSCPDPSWSWNKVTWGPGLVYLHLLHWPVSPVISPERWACGETLSGHHLHSQSIHASGQPGSALVSVQNPHRRAGFTGTRLVHRCPWPGLMLHTEGPSLGVAERTQE